MILFYVDIYQINNSIKKTTTKKPINVYVQNNLNESLFDHRKIRNHMQRNPMIENMCKIVDEQLINIDRIFELRFEGQVVEILFDNDR